jgi:hypothetical protein
MATGGSHGGGEGAGTLRRGLSVPVDAFVRTMDATQQSRGRLSHIVVSVLRERRTLQGGA